jgi:hypothetical protein
MLNSLPPSTSVSHPMSSAALTMTVINVTHQRCRSLGPLYCLRDPQDQITQSRRLHGAFLLTHLKEHFPAARGLSGHQLFISAFMIAVVPVASLVSVEASCSQVAAAQSLPSPGSSSPSSSSSGNSSPDSPDECLTPSSTEDPTQQPTIAHGSSHMHPHTHDATLKAKLISLITTTSIHMPDPSFAFAGPTVW